MIKISQNKFSKCCSCKANVGMIDYDINGFKFTLCEDCACFMSNMFFKCIEHGKETVLKTYKDDDGFVIHELKEVEEDAGIKEQYLPF